MFGIASTGWRGFLEDSLGLSPEAAFTFQAALHVHKHTLYMYVRDRLALDRPNVESTELSQICKDNPKQTWERRAFEDAIRCWKSEAERKGREIVVGEEDLMRLMLV